MQKENYITGAELIAKSLEVEGVNYIFTLAGDHVLPTLDVLSDYGFNILDTRHEQAAVHMADSWSRITGKLGVAIYTTPGFANAIPGLANAMHAESPMLSISGSAELSEAEKGSMQEIDQIGMAKPTTKGAWMVYDASRIPDMIAKALRVAFSGRKGPVHLTIPVDVQEQKVDKEKIVFFTPAEYRNQSISVMSQNQVEKIISELNKSNRPVIILGNACDSFSIEDKLKKFLDIAKVPTFTQGNARGIISDDYAHSVGFYDSGLNKATKKVQESDLVILVGTKQDLTLGYGMPPVISESAKLIQIDTSESEIGKNRGVFLGASGDIGSILSQMYEEALKYNWEESAWLKELQNERLDQFNELTSLSFKGDDTHAMEIFKYMKTIITPDDCLVFDGGDFCHFGRAYLPAQLPNRWWYVPTLGMLGTALPTGLAAKLANPNRRVFIFNGDGAFGFNGMEFDTAVRHNLPVVMILGNDSAWGIDKQIQLGVFGKTVATKLLPTKYHEVVKGLGGYGELVENINEFPGAIERALSSGLPSLINVKIKGVVSPRGQSAINRWKSNEISPI